LRRVWTVSAVSVVAAVRQAGVRGIGRGWSGAPAVCGARAAAQAHGRARCQVCLRPNTFPSQSRAPNAPKGALTKGRRHRPQDFSQQQLDAANHPVAAQGGLLLLGRLRLLGLLRLRAALGLAGGGVAPQSGDQRAAAPAAGRGLGRGRLRGRRRGLRLLHLRLRLLLRLHLLLRLLRLGLWLRLLRRRLGPKQGPG
jgi:hypothetical protein